MHLKKKNACTKISVYVLRMKHRLWEIRKQLAHCKSIFLLILAVGQKVSKNLVWFWPIVAIFPSLRTFVGVKGS